MHMMDALVFVYALRVTVIALLVVRSHFLVSFGMVFEVICSPLTRSPSSSFYLCLVQDACY